MQLIDTHCHIHDTEFYPDNRDEVYTQSVEAGVAAMICAGTDEKSSRQSIEFANTHDKCYALIGVHPHEAVHGFEVIADLLQENKKTIVGIGEIGLDYYYEHSPRQKQIQALEYQLQLAVDNNLPVSFHIRDAYDDFWPILDNFPKIRGVMHSFTDTMVNANIALGRDLFIGVNGISTFTKGEDQRTMYREIPLEKIVFETDAPFLTPAPLRGKLNIPAYVRRVVEHQASERSLDPEFVADISSRTARKIFSI